MKTRFAVPLLYPSRASVRGLALASVIASADLICAGAAVRLSSSGLGCPDWPGCTQTVLVAARRSSPPAILAAAVVLLAGLGVQATIGNVRYSSHLPAGLVWLHVTMSAVLWIFVLRLYLSTRERQPLPAVMAGRPAEHAIGGNCDNAEARAGCGPAVAPGA